MRFKSILLALVLCLPLPAVAETQAVVPIPLEQLLKRDVFGTIKISPTGEYLAATVPLEDRTSLVILRRSDLKPTGHVTLERNTHIASFTWVNPTRILFTIAQKFGELNQPIGTSEIYGVNADGTGQGRPLIGGRSIDMHPMASNIKQRSGNVGAALINVLEGDDEYVLVAVRESSSTYTEVDRMNVYDGRRSIVTKAPVPQADFLTDFAGAVHFAVGGGTDNRQKTYFRRDEKSAWELINDQAVTHLLVSPVGFNADKQLAYLEIEQESGPDGIYAFDMSSKERKLVARDDMVDPGDLLLSPVTGAPYAITYDAGKPRIEYLEPQDPFARSLKALQASLNGMMVLPTSFSKDGSLGVYVAYSDNIVGDFYLLDRNTGKAAYLASRNSWLAPETLATMRAVTIQARDGLKLEAFLTLPVGSSGKNLPLVVNPHGGPFGISDSWGYNLDAQVLASRGYAVLQVNFRGSGNYGRAFLVAGYRQWGRKMQDDLTDATHWAVEQGVADSHRICLYGASYGGYASLMGVAKEPALYRCAFGNVGVYDLPAVLGEGSDSESVKNFLEETLGRDNLLEISPDHLASQIMVPVYMTAGKEDYTAPMHHTEMMRDALQRLGKPVEVKFYDHEGHGNYLLANRLDFYQRLLAFLDKNIGSGSQASPPGH